MKKSVLIVTGLAIAAALTALTGFLHSMRLAPDLSNARHEASAKNEVPLGDTVDCRVTVTLPLAAPPPEMVVTPPSDTVLGGPVRVTRGRYRWNRCDWHLSAVLRTFKPGAAAGGKMTVVVKGRFPAEAAFPIPDFVVAPVAAGEGEPALADKLPETPKRGSWRWITIGIVLAALIAWAVAARCRKPRAQAEKKLPPWERAEQDLARLEADVAGRRTGLAPAFLRLTDLVRKYLEERYRLPVTSRTTDEFMRDMRDASPLPDAEQPFLRDFLGSADLVKFAKMPPDEAMFRRSADGARALIRHTSPQGGEVPHV